GLPVPEIVFVEIDAALGRNEPDYEIRELLSRSVGLNLALDYLPGSVMFDPAASDRSDPELASRAVWFDAFITNIDRTARNPNLLCWHKNLYLIDHGAALYFHHNWGDIETAAASPFAPIRNHILLPWAGGIEEADRVSRALLKEDVLSRVVNSVPDPWLLPVPGLEDPEQKRSGYLRYFLQRLQNTSHFVTEAIRAHAELI
ncbi:MAG: HipA family kinase, partial [Bryobacteraceae bacterium]